MVAPGTLEKLKPDPRARFSKVAITFRAKKAI